MTNSSKFSISWLKIFSLLAISFCLSTFLISEEKNQSMPPEKGYTINFENVSIQEFLRFVSKIAGMNVIYNDEDLNFNITIFSEEETTLENVMSILVQILRIHNFSLLEEGQNLLIHRNPQVRQIPTVVPDGASIKDGDLPPVVTKIFRIYKGNPSHIADLISPLLSQQAFVEVSAQTRQLIITDTLSSIQTIEELLVSLDTPQIPYDIDVYYAKDIPAMELATLAMEILQPLSEGAMLKIIPQNDTQSIYIVSTPFLLDKTLTVLQEVDKPAVLDFSENLSAENIFVYHLKGREPDIVKQNLNKMIEQAKNQGFNSNVLFSVLQNAKYIPSVSALLFVGPPKTLKIIASFLESLELANRAPDVTGFFLYEPTGLSVDATENVLKEIQGHLQQTGHAHPALFRAISSAKIIPPLNAILFTGSPSELQEVKALLSSIEKSYEIGEAELGPNNFLIYKIQAANESQMSESLHNLADYLENNDIPNTSLINAIDSMKWIQASNSLLFTGHAKALEELKTLLPSFDIAPSLIKSPVNSEFLVYTPKMVPAKVMEKLIHETADNLKSADLADPSFLKTLESVRLVPSANQLIFTGDKTSLARLDPLLQDLDQKENLHGGRGSDFKLVRVKPGNGESILRQLKSTAERLRKSGTASSSLIATLESAEWVPGSSNILITGSEKDVVRAEELIKNYDEELVPTDKNEVFVYKLKYISFAELKAALMGIAEHSESQDSKGPAGQLGRTIETMRQIPDSNAVQFVGAPQTLVKIKDLLTILDTPEHAKSSVQKGMGSNFLVYHVKNLPPTELIAYLKSIAQDSLSSKNKQDSSLLRSINTVRYVKGSNALIFTGNKVDLDKIHMLLQRLDQGEKKEGPSDRIAESYQIYTPQYVPGPELVQMLKNFQDHLITAGVSDTAVAEVIDHLSYVNRTNTIILTGSSEGIAHVLDLLKRFDNPSVLAGTEGADIETLDNTGFLLYKVQNISGESLVNALRQIGDDVAKSSQGQGKNRSLVEAISSVQWIEATNSLLATGENSVLKSVNQLMESLDRPLKQVFIEILVVETSADSDLEFGLSWQSQGRVHDRFSWGTGNYPPENTTVQPFARNVSAITGDRTPQGQDIPPMTGGFLGIIGDLLFHKGKTYASLGSLLNALKTHGNATVVLSQKIVVQDNQNAKIFSGDNVPFTGSLVTTSGLSQTTNANLEYRNIGVTVNLTPIIGDNGLITMDINEEISEEANTGSDTSTSVSLTTVNGIRTSKTSMQTRVHVPDRAFLILSGTMRNQVVRSVTGIPCLGGLPLIGAAFSETKKRTVNRNVVIFMKPHIIKTNEIYGEITRNQEELYGSLDQGNPEDFDRALEIVKTPDDMEFEESDKNFMD